MITNINFVNKQQNNTFCANFVPGKACAGAFYSYMCGTIEKMYL